MPVLWQLGSQRLSFDSIALACLLFAFRLADGLDVAQSRRVPSTFSRFGGIDWLLGGLYILF